MLTWAGWEADCVEPTLGPLGWPPPIVMTVAATAAAAETDEPGPSPAETPGPFASWGGGERGAPSSGPPGWTPLASAGGGGSGINGPKDADGPLSTPSVFTVTGAAEDMAAAAPLASGVGTAGTDAEEPLAAAAPPCSSSSLVRGWCGRATVGAMSQRLNMRRTCREQSGGRCLAKTKTYSSGVGAYLRPTFIYRHRSSLAE